METLQRYSPLSWTAAVAISVCAWAETFKYDTLTITAFWIAVFAVAGWILIRWTVRFTRKLPAGESKEPAMLRAIAWLGFALFALCTGVSLAWAFIVVYPDPAAMRAYAESLGIDLRPYFLGALAIGAAVALLCATAIRALDGSAPRGAWPVRLVFFAAPVGWAVLGACLLAVAEEFKGAWAEFGADLPSPTLLVLAGNDYLGFPAAAAFALAGLTWLLRTNASAFRSIATVEILLLMLFSGYFTLAVLAAVLPLIKACSAI